MLANPKHDSCFMPKTFAALHDLNLCTVAISRKNGYNKMVVFYVAFSAAKQCFQQPAIFAQTAITDTENAFHEPP